MNEIEQLKERVRYLETVIQSLTKSDRFTFERKVQFIDGVNIQLGRNLGTIIGTDTDQLLGFYGEQPVAKQTGVPATAVGLATALVTLGLISTV